MWFSPMKSTYFILHHEYKVHHGSYAFVDECNGQTHKKGIIFTPKLGIIIICVFSQQWTPKPLSKCNHNDKHVIMKTCTEAFLDILFHFPYMANQSQPKYCLKEKSLNGHKMLKIDDIEKNLCGFKDKGH